MNEFIVDKTPPRSPFPWLRICKGTKGTFGIHPLQLCEDIRENKNGMLDRLLELSAESAKKEEPGESAPSPGREPGKIIPLIRETVK